MAALVALHMTTLLAAITEQLIVHFKETCLLFSFVYLLLLFNQAINLYICPYQDIDTYTAHMRLQDVTHYNYH